MFRSVLSAPPTLVSLRFFSSLPEREGGASRPSLPPTPAMPGHFCLLETFPPRGHPGPSPGWAAGCTDGLAARDPGSCLRPTAAQALPWTPLPPSQAEESALPRRAARPSRVRPRGLARRGGGGAGSGLGPGPVGGCGSWAALQSPSGAPWPLAAGRGEGPAGWGRGRRLLEAWLAAAFAGFQPRGTPRLYRDPIPLPPTIHPPPNWQTLASDKPGFQSRRSHCQLCRSDLGYGLHPLWSLAPHLKRGDSHTYITPAGWEPQKRQWAKLLSEPHQLLIPSSLPPDKRQRRCH